MGTTPIEPQPTAARTPSLKGAKMWPSEIVANRIFDAANTVLIVGLVLSIIGTVLVVWMGNVKESYLKKELADTAERTANTNARAALLENDSARAKLELEQLKRQVGPRTLNREAFQKALAGQPKIPVEILYLRDDPDSMLFAQEIENNLVAAKWTVISRNPIPRPIGNTSQEDIPAAMTVGGQPSGVVVVSHSVTLEEVQASTNDLQGKAWLKTPWTVLNDAFLKSMGAAKSSSHPTCPEGILRVVVSPK